MSFQTLILSRAEIEQQPPSHQQRAISAGRGNNSLFSVGDEFQLFRFAKRNENLEIVLCRENSANASA